MQSSAGTRASTKASQVQGVSTTSGGLVKATLGAAVVAGAILTFVWLPAEHGIDPSGVGHLLGLTEMGHIKEQLHADADADVAASLMKSTVPDADVTDMHRKLDAIQAQLDVIAVSVGANEPIANEQSVTGQSEALPLPAIQSDSSTEANSTWSDEVDYTLAPDQGIEIKLVMDEGAIAEFEWSANGAVVNHDTHGDGSGQSISYEKGRSVPQQAGQLTAAFTGNHGWFWRNRTDAPVVVTLRTRGDYKQMLLP